MKRRPSTALYWVVGTLALAMLPQLAAMPLTVSALTLAPLGWRLMAERRGWKPMPLLLRVAVTAVVVAALMLHFGGLYGRRAAVGFLAVMLAVKLLETFRIRDERVVTCMSLFLVATQFLFSQGLAMLVYGVACLASALVTLALLQRREAFAVTGHAPPPARPWAELAFSARLLAMAVPFALALFLFVPRWGSPLWGVPEEALDARTGLSDTMTPGTIQSLFMDDSPAFRVEFHGVQPPPSALYWRGPVLSNFDGLSWRHDFYQRNIAADDRPAVADSPWRYTVQLEPHESHWLFALDYPAVVPRGARLTMDFQLYTVRPVTNLREYEMLSDPAFRDSPDALGQTHLRNALELPSGFNPRTLELMARWRGETPDDAALVRRVLTHFNRETFHYTLNPPLLSRHSVDEFLFETRAGFCEHYASAFTVMMRAAGIPARVVTGYQGGWRSGAGDYLLVRQSDAHAWSEVWLPGSGWNRVDPTAAVAPSRIESGAMEAFAGRRHMLDFAWVRAARNRLDLLGRNWNDWVIAYDAVRQSRLLDPFGIAEVGWRGLALGLVASLAFLALLLVPMLLRWHRDGRPDRAQRTWAAFRRSLQRGGLPLRASLGPLEIAAAAGARWPERRALIEAVTGAWLRLRYAGEEAARAELQVAWRAFRRARA